MRSDFILCYTTKRTPKPRNVVNLSIDALDRISFRNGHIITTTIIALVFERGLFLGIVFCFFMGAWVGFNFSFVVWASIFFCTAVGWKDSFFVFVLLFEPVFKEKSEYT